MGNLELVISSTVKTGTENGLVLDSTVGGTRNMKSKSGDGLVRTRQETVKTSSPALLALSGVYNIAINLMVGSFD